jgi:hypothetical protein
MRRAFVALGFLLLAAGAAYDLGRLHDSVPWQRMIDLPDFYCAGHAILQHRNPYLSSSLADCERAAGSAAAVQAAYVAPAPQPPFDFPAFALLAKLSYRDAKIAAASGIAFAVVVTALALRSLGVPLAATLAALALCDGFVGIFQGQIYPIAVMFVVLAAAALAKNREALAGVFAALSLIEPQIGVPVCTVLLLWARHSRRTLLATACVMLAAGALTTGPASFAQWALDVVPANARAEASAWGQYSVTSVLTAAGVPAAPALLAGSVWYVLMIGVAAWAARRLNQRFHRKELLALVPAAFCVIGGTYVHVEAIAAAVPLALLLATLAPSSLRWRIAASVVLISIPWIFVQALKPLFFPALLVIAVLCAALQLRARASAAFIVAGALALYFIALRTPPPLERPHPAGAHASPLASSAMPISGFDPTREIAKVPTWAGLVALFATSVAL